MTNNKQIANVYYDHIDEAYRLDVEYYVDSVKMVNVRIEIAGDAAWSFSEIENKAYEESSKVLSGVLADYDVGAA